MGEGRRGRIGTGVGGLDDAMDGGLPAGYGTMVIGDTGTGKTVLAMQMLCQAAREGASAALISLEESASGLVDNRGGFGWGIESLVDGGALRLVNARDTALGVATGEFHLDGLMAGTIATLALAVDAGRGRRVFLGDFRRRQDLQAF